MQTGNSEPMDIDTPTLKNPLNYTDSQSKMLKSDNIVKQKTTDSEKEVRCVVLNVSFKVNISGNFFLF